MKIRQILLLPVLMSVIISNSVLAQSLNIYSGKITDAQTKAGIKGVHIYDSNNIRVGTITNSEGQFVLKSRKPITKISISHLAYEAITYTVTGSTKNIEISLESAVATLETVEVTALTALAVMGKVIENLETNHFSEPVTYDFFSRIIDPSKDNTLHYLEEHSGYIRQMKNHKSEFSLKKSRRRTFTKKGEEKISKYLVSLTSIYIDNVGVYTEHFLHKKKHKGYHFTFKEDVNLLGQEVYVIDFKNDKDKFWQEGTLYISKEDFGIVRKKTKTKTVDFKRIDNRYYLSFSERLSKGSFVTTVYNKLDTDMTDRVFVKPQMLFSPQYTKTLFGDFDDDFWENNNYIPLPDWIREQLEQSKNIPQ